MPHTQDKPKVMVPLVDQPMVVWQLAWLRSHGIRKIIIAAGYKAEVLKKFLGDGSAYGLSIDYSVEDQPLGTGGALKRALKQTSARSVVVTNGDIITECDLTAMITAHHKSGAQVTVMAVPCQLPWDTLSIDDHQRITAYQQKPRLDHRISGGIFVIDRAVKNILPDTGDQEATLLKTLPKEQFRAFLADDYWIAVDTVKDKGQVEAYLQNSGFMTKYS